VNPPSGWTEELVKTQAMNLAAFSQAYRLRDLEYPRTDSEPEAPKADAPEAGADYAESLKAAAAPHQEKIRSMIGMDAVAKEVDGLVAQAIIAKRREAAGLKTEARPLHLVFTGNPGTGKTSVAEIIGPLYADLGLIKNGKVTTLTKSEIIGPFNNQVEKHTREALMKAEGGVIIIDEAYTLATDAEGRKAIEEMVPMLSKELKDTVVILAGYPGRMEEFMAVNEGLDRRFPKTIKFKDYSASEMREIADVMLMAREYTATKPATVKAIEDAVEQLSRKKNNGNGGGVSNFIDRARDAQEVRLMKVKEPTKAQLAELTAADIKYAMMATGLTPSTRKKAA
jgi:stage V sporulation protein K